MVDDFEQFVAEFVDGFGGSCGDVGVRVWTVVLEVEPFVKADVELLDIFNFNNQLLIRNEFPNQLSKKSLIYGHRSWLKI